MASPYYFGQGKIFLSPIDPVTKLPTNEFIWVGNVPTLTLSPNVEMVEHNESYTGDRLLDLKIETTKNMTGTLIFEEWSKENLEKILYGNATTITTASVTEEEHTAKVGYSFPLNHIGLTAFTSLTNDGAITTYVNGTDYSVNLKSGMITIPSGSSISDDSVVEANYTFGQYDDVKSYTRDNIDYWLRFDGLNSADDNRSIVVDICRIRLMPPASIDLIGEEIAQLECEFGALYQAQLDIAGGAYEGGFMRKRFQ